MLKQKKTRIALITAGLLLLLFLSPWLVPVNRAALERSASLSYRVYDKDGELLREAANRNGERHVPVSLEAVSPFFVDALLAIEDRRFHQHAGVDIRSGLRAFFQNTFYRKKVSGASTLSMQLVRIIHDIDRSIPGKLRQLWEALRIERVLSKDEILERYINSVSFGQGTVGIETASIRYFNKRALYLSLDEASLLAGIIQAPGALDPIRFPERAERRRLLVLDAMTSLYPHLEEELVYVREHPPLLNLGIRPIQAGHFTDFALSQTRKPGDIQTTLDGDLNREIEAMVRMHVDMFKDAGLTNAAVLVLDNRTGAIRAMVGSRDWNDPEAGSVNGCLSLRQPGSTLKPFAYELALEKGVSPRAVLADVETMYHGSDRTLYMPENYSRVFRGPVILQDALAFSLNVPAIRLVQEELGVEPFLERLRSLGFSRLKEGANYYGLGLVLGNGEVSLLELAAAYACLAGGGIYREPFAIARVGDTDAGKRVLDEKNTAIITEILANEALRAEAFGIANPLRFEHPVAVKTGTSNQFRDAWCLGYTPDFTLGVWAGNFNADPMDGMAGASGAGTLFAKVMRELFRRNRGSSPFKYPEGMKRFLVCSYSGALPGPYCGKTSIVASYEENVSDMCPVHKEIELDSRTGRESGYHTPQEYRIKRVVTDLPVVFDQWLSSKNYATGFLASGEHREKLMIMSPVDGDVYILEPGYTLETQTVEFRVQAADRPKSISYYLNGRLLGAVPWPYTYNWRIERGEHELYVKLGAEQSRTVHFRVE